MSWRPTTKTILFSVMIALSLIAWLFLLDPSGEVKAVPQEHINLALRRTADRLLRNAGDNTSRIPAVSQTAPDIWRIQFEGPFSYDNLPAQLTEAFAQYEIVRPWRVAVRRCEDAVIDLGFHSNDIVADTTVPCGGRAMPEGCHYVEVAFLDDGNSHNVWLARLTWFVLGLGVAAGLWALRKRWKPTPVHHIAETGDWLAFGNSKLDIAGQVLLCGTERHSLTFREAKLLRLFVTHTGQILERDAILQQVWADEGVLVGRSLDVFVSRLRKKLASDSTVTLATVHGVGYRLEAG